MCVGYFMSCSAGWRRWLMATKKSSGRSNCRAYAAAGVLSTNATRAARRDNPSKGGDNERGDDTLRHMNPPPLQLQLLSAPSGNRAGLPGPAVPRPDFPLFRPTRVSKTRALRYSVPSTASTSTSGSREPTTTWRPRPEEQSIAAYDRSLLLACDLLFGPRFDE